MTGIASLALPHVHQVAIAAVDSQGYVHLYFTPIAADPATAPDGASATALGLSRSALDSRLGHALEESGLLAASGEARLDSYNSGWFWGSSLIGKHPVLGFHFISLECMLCILCSKVHDGLLQLGRLLDATPVQ